MLERGEVFKITQAAAPRVDLPTGISLTEVNAQDQARKGRCWPKHHDQTNRYLRSPTETSVSHTSHFYLVRQNASVPQTLRSSLDR